MRADPFPLPLLGFVAWSGTGKTTLLEQVIPLLRARGLRVALIKHAHHAFDVDQPGKDSYRLRAAGAGQVLLASRRRLALMVERESEAEPGLRELLGLLDPAAADLVLVEGFKHETYPKVEVCRPALGQPLLFPEDADVIAVASDAPLPVPCTLPRLDLNDPAGVAAFVAGYAQSPAAQEARDVSRV